MTSQRKQILIRKLFLLFKVSILPLYIIYFLFIVAAIFSIATTENLYYYIATLLGFLSIYILIIIDNKHKQLLTDKSNVLLVSLMLSLISSSFFHSKEPIAFFMMYIFISTIIYFKYFRITTIDLVRFLNITYLIYVLLSLFSYFDIFISYAEHVRSFTRDFGIITFDSLKGLEGSTANIDSYSAIILLVNIFLNKKNIKIFFIVVSLFILLWTTRFTPLVALVLSLSVFFIVRNKSMALLFLAFIFIGFFSAVFIEIYYPDNTFFLNETSNKALFHTATHGRTHIWSEQFINIYEYFNVYDVLFGNSKYAEVEIFWSKGFTSNPHNSFLYLFFGSGLIGILMIIYFITMIIKTFDRNTFPIIYVIFISASTNGTIFYVANPIYLILLVYLTHYYKNNKVLRKLEKI